MNSVLLLNSSYEPLKVVDWQKAMILWLLDKVEVLEFYDLKIRSETQSFTLPAVLRLKRYIRHRHDHARPKLSRNNIYARDNQTCQYCGQHFNMKSLTLDHVIPSSRGGANSWSNLVTACFPCNQAKGDLTPKEAKMPLRSTPEQPTHFYFPKIHHQDEEREKELWLNYL